MKSRASQHILVILIWVTCLIVVGLSIFFVYMVYSNDREYQAISEEIHTVVDKDERLSSVRNLVRDTKSDMDKLDSFFVEEDAIPRFVSSLEDLGDTYGASLSVSSLMIDPSGEGSRVKPLKVKLSGSGKWQNIVSLLSKLESTDRALSVESLALTKRTEGGKDVDAGWNILIELRVLVLGNIKK